MHITTSIPTEEELLKILQLIFQFHQKNPSLLVGIMDMTIFNLPYYIIAQYTYWIFVNRYLLRTKKATLNELDSLLMLSKSFLFHFPILIQIFPMPIYYLTFVLLLSIPRIGFNVFTLLHGVLCVFPWKFFHHNYNHLHLDRFPTSHFALRGRTNVLVASPWGACLFLYWKWEGCIGSLTRQH